MDVAISTVVKIIRNSIWLQIGTICCLLLLLNGSVFAVSDNNSLNDVALIDCSVDVTSDVCDLEQPQPLPDPTPTPTPDTGEKELIVSESMPDWLLQIEKDLAAAQTITEQPTVPTPVIISQPVRRQTAPLSSPTSPAVIEQPQPTPQPPATQVAGVSSAVETLPVEQKPSFNAWYVVPVLFVAVLLGGAWRKYAKARY